MAAMTMIQALNSALDVMMARDPDVLTFGVTRPPIERMFEEVYKDQPWHLARQQAEVLADAAEAPRKAKEA